MDNMFMYNFDVEKNKVDSDLELKNKALEDIIANQQEEENKIKDNYDSLDSRAGRFLEVLGAGLSGGNAAQVAQNQRDNLNRQLQSAQARYKDQRDSAYNQYKDLLARREALDKSKYERERDLVKDDQFNRELQFKKDIADQNDATERLKINAANKTQVDKAKQEQEDLEKKNKEEAERRKAVEDKINKGLTSTFKDGFTIPLWGKNVFGGDKKEASLKEINSEIARSLGVKEDGIAKYLEENKNIFPQKDDDESLIEFKYNALGYPSKRLKGLELEGKLEAIDKVTGDREQTKELVRQYGSVDEVLKMFSR